MTASKFRKKPVTIEARQMGRDLSPRESMAVCQWVEEHGYPWLYGDATKPDELRVENLDGSTDLAKQGIYIDPADGMLVIRTLEGDMKVSLDDWIIRGVQGEFYPCKPDIFAATYEPA